MGHFEETEPLSPAMPFDLNTVINKQYNILPIPPSLIQSHSGSKQHILWVGCSDSLTSETDSLGVNREEIFVHRNLGNLLSNEDLSSQSAIAWGVDLLKVDHIVVCGHYDCALIKAKADASVLNGWHIDVTKLHTVNERHLSLSDETLDERSVEHRLEEVYILAEVDWLKKQPNVKDAIDERGLQLHAFVYDKEENRCLRLVETVEGGFGGGNA